MKVKHILISQPAPPVLDHSPFQDLIAKHHLDLDFLPFIRVERVTTKEFRAQRVEILAHTAVIFTNRSSIDYFFQICEETRTTIPESMKYFCMTEAIALYLQKYIVYRKRKIFFGKGTFAELMEVVVKHREETFLLPLPDSHKPEIPKSMDKLRLKYDKVILSRTVPAELEGVDIAKYDLLAFYSPSEIAVLTARYPEAGTGTTGPMIAVFGNSTAVAAVEAGLAIRVLAPTPEAPSMTTALDLFIKKINAGEQVLPVETVERRTIDVSHLKTDKRRPSRAKTKAAATKTPAKAKPGVSVTKTTTGKTPA